MAEFYPGFPNRSHLNRRAFLYAAGSLTAALSARTAWGAVRRHVRWPGYPFMLGVASGDPAPHGVVIWTRLAPVPLEGGGMPPEPVAVDWQVAEDEQMSKVVQSGTKIARPELAHSIHVEVNGLEPDRWYWYQFRAGGETSPKGRTRTMPALNSHPDLLKFAFASCNHYETGHFTAFEHMAKEDLDLIFHLGDYIYEGAGREKQVRRHLGKEIYSLEDYRTRYAQYKMDASLQRAHASCPWVVTPDDHEVDNNYAGIISEEKNVFATALLARRAAAYQAYYEHMPLRSSSLPHGPDIELYRPINFGQLAEFSVLDTRQYRTDQPCDDGNKAPCPGAYDPQGTLLGARQKSWLFHRLGSSRARWNVLAQQVMMARVDRKSGSEATFSMDQWPGYEAERREVLRFMRERSIANPVVLTGDIHSNWANDLVADFNGTAPKTVATEFVGTSISSGGDGNKSPNYLPALHAENPFVKFHNTERGYVRCRVDQSGWKTDYQAVEYVTRPGAPLITRASFVVEAGRAGIQAG